MTDQRFEDWWVRNPARVALSHAAKEVARGVWQVAREDLVAELNGEAVPAYWQPMDTAPNGEIWVKNSGRKARAVCTRRLGGPWTLEFGSGAIRAASMASGNPTHWRPVSQVDSENKVPPC